MIHPPPVDVFVMDLLSRQTLLSGLPVFQGKGGTYTSCSHKAPPSSSSSWCSRWCCLTCSAYSPSLPASPSSFTRPTSPTTFIRPSASIHTTDSAISAVSTFGRTRLTGGARHVRYLYHYLRSACRRLSVLRSRLL